MAKKKVVDEVIEEVVIEGPAAELDFDLTASEFLVDSADFGTIEALVRVHNFKDVGRVYAGEKELVVLRK